MSLFKREQEQKYASTDGLQYDLVVRVETLNIEFKLNLGIINSLANSNLIFTFRKVPKEI